MGDADRGWTAYAAAVAAAAAPTVSAAAAAAGFPDGGNGVGLRRLGGRRLVRLAYGRASPFALSPPPGTVRLATRGRRCGPPWWWPPRGGLSAHPVDGVGRRRRAWRGWSDSRSGTTYDSGRRQRPPSPPPLPPATAAAVIPPPPPPPPPLPPPRVGRGDHRGADAAATASGDGCAADGDGDGNGGGGGGVVGVGAWRRRRSLRRAGKAQLPPPTCARARSCGVAKDRKSVV